MKESVRILRFAIVGSSNALITALVIWILMDILDCNYFSKSLLIMPIDFIYNLHS